MKKLIAVTALVASLASLAACSSSGGKASKTTPAGTSAATSGSTTPSTNASTAEAATLTTGYEATPTDIGISGPLGQAAPTGKTLAWLQCDVPVCATITTGLKQAVAAVGWKLVTIPFKLADAETLSSAIDQAAALSPTPAALVVTGPPPSSWASKLPELKAKGIPVISGYVGHEDITDEVITNFGDTGQVQTFGKMLADWTIADSGGTAHALVLSDPELSTFADYVDGYQAEIKRICPGCKVTDLSVSLADLGANAVAGKVVSAIQSDSSLKYVIFPTGDYATGVASALSAAGIKGVKIGGETAEPADFQAIKAGTENAWTGLPLIWTGWAIVDVAMRHLLGKAVPAYGATIPKQIITSANVSTIDPTVPFVGVPDFQTAFKTAWGVS